MARGESKADTPEAGALLISQSQRLAHVKNIKLYQLVSSGQIGRGIGHGKHQARRLRR